MLDPCCLSDSQVDEYDRALVADFGLSHAFRAEPEAKTNGFSLLYAAPEVLIGKGGGLAADVFAFGRILLEVIGGVKLVEQAVRHNTISSF